MGGFIRLSKQKEYSKGYVYVLYAVLAVVSLLTGLATIRYIFIINTPLFLAALWLLYNANKKGKPSIKELLKTNEAKMLYIALGCTIIAFLGYFINTNILSKYYTFAVQTEVPFSSKAVLTIVDQSFGEILKAFGYTAGVKALSFDGIINILAFVAMGITIFCVAKLFKNRYKNKDYGQNLIVVFFMVSFGVNFFVYGFVDFWDIPYARFYMPVIILIVPIFAIYFKNTKNKFSKMLIFVLLLMYIFCSGFGVLINTKETDVNKDIKGAMEYLINNDYEYGYATFTQSDVITVFSDGKVEVAKFILDEAGNITPHKWLSPKKYFAEGYHTGKTFLLLTKNKDSVFTKEKGNLVYEDEGYVIYNYETNPNWEELIVQG